MKNILSFFMLLAMFILICRYNRVFAFPGDDVTLSSHLSPETNVESMEVRWFRGTECIYLYKNGQVSVGKGYEGRVNLLSPELKRGNVSLVLKSIAPLDTGTYSCQVLTGHNMVEKSINLYMSGMEPLSPDKIGPTLTEQDSADMQESVIILELKKLLQQREKELQDKTRELETITEMLSTTSNLECTDMGNMNKLANQNEERFKSVASELETCMEQLETLERKLQEKDTQVKELRGILKDKERELWESKEEHITDGLKSTAPDTEESVHLLELKKQFQKKDKELKETAKQLESRTRELMKVKATLQGREKEVANLAKERDEYSRNMDGQMELCLRELEALGQKLLEKNAQVKELQVILQGREQELGEEKRRQGESEHVKTANEMADVSRGPFVSELLEKSEGLLSKMNQNPKEQLEVLECWIYKKRAVRRLREEEERTAVLKKEFLDYVSAVKELIEKKHEKIVAWAKMTAVLQDKLEVVEKDEEREALEMQVKEALEMQRQGQEQIESLTEGIGEKRRGIEEKHKYEMEEIREKYSTVARIEAETNILKIILPDVQAYFRNIAADLHGILDARRRNGTNEIGGETRTRAHAETENHSDGLIEEEVRIQTEVEAVSAVKSSPEINNNRVETLAHKVVVVQAERGVARQPNRTTDKICNLVIVEEPEIEAEIKEGGGQGVNEQVETGEEDMTHTQ